MCNLSYGQTEEFKSSKYSEMAGHYNSSVQVATLSTCRKCVNRVSEIKFPDKKRDGSKSIVRKPRSLLLIFICNISENC